uniref:Uncharacterized protein n=1 Tax=Cannabis sativa TaxID=3483 RepID=A0A803QXW3_CANSA
MYINHKISWRSFSTRNLHNVKEKNGQTFVLLLFQSIHNVNFLCIYHWNNEKNLIKMINYVT